MGTLVQNAATYETGSDSNIAVVYGSNVVSGNLLIIAVGFYSDTITVSSVTDTRSTSYTQAGTLLRAAVTGDDAALAVYYGLAPSSGANTITVTFSGANAQKSAAAFEWSGVNATTPLNQTAGVTVGNVNTITTGNITTTQPGPILKFLVEWTWTTHNHAAGTPSTGWTEYNDTAEGYDSAYRNETGTGTFNGGFTTGASMVGGCCRIVAFADAALTVSLPPRRDRLTHQLLAM